jgi:hypothetical protein
MIQIQHVPSRVGSCFLQSRQIRFSLYSVLGSHERYILSRLTGHPNHNYQIWITTFVGKFTMFNLANGLISWYISFQDGIRQRFGLIGYKW